MRHVTAATLGLTLLVRTAAAQTAPSAITGLEGEIRLGEKVAVMTSDGTTVSGPLRALTADSLSLETRNGLETLPADRIGRIVSKDSVRNGLWIGLGVGAAAGLAGGLLVNAICVNETGGCLGTVFGLTAIGAAAGAGIGAGADGLRHRTVFDAMPDMPREYAPHVAVNLALGQSETRGRGMTGPPSAGAAWGMRHSSGFGLEFDVNHTFGGSTRMISCADAPSTAPSLEGCVGEGRQGIQDTTIGSAKVQYFFSNSRVQPYVSGGVGIYQSSAWISAVAPRFLSGEPSLNESLSRRRGVAVVAGGGARIALTRQMSLRPDITIYKADDWTHVRAGLGLGVGW
jgi:opacity protein-like surface antigen